MDSKNTFLKRLSKTFTPISTYSIIVFKYQTKIITNLDRGKLSWDVRLASGGRGYRESRMFHSCWSQGSTTASAPRSCWSSANPTLHKARPPRLSNLLCNFLATWLNFTYDESPSPSTAKLENPTSLCNTKFCVKQI